MKVIGYLRVSTDRQAEEGLGLEVQEQAIRKWCRDHRHRLVGLHTDDGVSGSNGLDTRIGLAEALEAIRDGRAKAIVVFRLDRLARDLIVQETLLAEVSRLGGEVFSTSGGESDYLVDDPDDPSRKLIRQVLGAIAEYEKSMITLRLRMGRRRKDDKGGYAFGSPALGYRAEGGELVEDRSEQAVISRITELKDDGLSIRQIAEHMMAEGHRTKRGGTTWHPTTVARVLGRAA